METSVKEFFGLQLFSRTLTDSCFCHTVFWSTAGQDICLFLVVKFLNSPWKIQSSPNELHIKTYSEPSQTSTMWLFMSRINGFQPFISSVKYSILDVWVGSDYASDIPVRKLPTHSLIYLVSISISKSIVICEEMMVAYLIITSWQFMIR